MRELFNNPKEEEYLSEFKQKIAQEMQEDIEQRRHDLERSRNGFIGAVAGIILAGVVSWFLLLPYFGFNQDKEIPVIHRPILPVKIQPSEPGGMDIQNKDKTVYTLVEKSTEIDTKVESLLPPPETPKIPTIVASEPQNLEPTVSSDENNVNNIDELIAAVQTTATEKIKIPEKLPVIDVVVVKTSEPLTARDEEPKIQTEQEPQKEIPSTQKEPETPTSKLQGKWCVQLMASSQKEAVEKGYQSLLKQHPILKDLPYIIESGKDALARLKVGGYATKQEADDLCANIKKSGGTCMVKEN